MSQSGSGSNPTLTQPGAPERSPLQRAIAALEKMKARLDAVERAANEPIAIVGIGCRFPGAGEGPEAFWHVLERGIDAVREIPAERWGPELIPGEHSEARWAGLLEDIAQFDAEFFGISRREAVSLDPQQRLLLEVSWQALEDAGQNGNALFGGLVGVFVGIYSTEYRDRVLAQGLTGLDAYCGTGNLLSTAAGRISYSLGLQGPALSIDTACSSSLVSIEQACQSLRAGDCQLAIAGGVNAILSPSAMALAVGLQALSPDGRCKTLDARANGFVRGEGCGMVVLKRLSDAIRDGDRIRAVIRGWAINQDGRSTGLTAPNVLSQQAMLRQALVRARLEPSDIGYIEMHGTGTPLGDPIEAEALLEVFGGLRPDRSSCVLGAVKTNIGHLESAAGVAGLVKVVLAMERESIPPNIHFRRLNPRISLANTPFVIPTESIPWPRGEKPRRAGVSSFGISGTNAHVILEEAPHSDVKPAKEAPAYLLPLSAKSPKALVAMAHSYAEWLSGPNDISLPDVVYTASVRRTHHEHRLSATFSTRDEAASVLSAYARGESPVGVMSGKTPTQGRPKLVYVFSGQGSQWAEMGKRMLADIPVCRAKLEQIDALVRNYSRFSVIEEISLPEGQSRLGETEIVQPALFAIEVALAELLRSWGIMPDAVIGHSVGEIAAAHVSGAISLDDAVRLVVLRGRIMQKATGFGKMVWVALPLEEALRWLEGRAGSISIAAMNDPNSVVLSGATMELEQLVSELSGRGVLTKPLRVDYAFHSAQMEPLAQELAGSLGSIGACRTTIPMISTVTGERVAGDELGASYWRRNVRETVHFSRAIATALREDFTIFVEVGPHPVLLSNLQQCISASACSDAAAFSTLRRHAEPLRAMLSTFGALSVHGFPVEWPRLSPEGGRVVDLPGYAWQRERYWIDLVSSDNDAERSVVSARPASTSYGDLRERVISADVQRRAEILEVFISELARSALGFTREAVLLRDAGFSTLGMDSLMALEISRRIKDSLGVAVPGVAIFRYPTVAALAAHIDALLSELPDSQLRVEPPLPERRMGDLVVAFREVGTLSPLFLAHPVEGSALSLWGLLRHLNAERPLYVFQARGFASDEAPFGTIEEMAGAYVAAMRKIQPRGPYHIGGYSFGGIVAFEMARLIEELGEVVSEVVLIDTPAPFGDEARGQTLDVVASLSGLPLHGVAVEGEALDARVGALAEAMALRVALETTTPEGRNRLQLLESNLRALVNYSPRRSAVRLCLVRATAPVDSRAAEVLERLGKTYGWGRWSEAEIRVEDVMATHQEVIREPHAARVVTILEQMIAEKTRSKDGIT